MLTRFAGEFDIEKSSQMRLFPVIGALSISIFFSELLNLLHFCSEEFEIRKERKGKERKETVGIFLGVKFLGAGCFWQFFAGRNRRFSVVFSILLILVRLGLNFNL